MLLFIQQYKNFIQYTRIGKLFVEIISHSTGSHNTGSDIWPNCCNILKDAFTNFLQFKSTLTLRPSCESRKTS